MQLTNRVTKRDRLPANLWGVRVVTYDINDPFWGKNLRKDIASTLNAFKLDPNKGIPDTFQKP